MRDASGASNTSTLGIDPLGESACVFSRLDREFPPDVTEAAKRPLTLGTADN
jgi:hypothetical protein